MNKIKTALKIFIGTIIVFVSIIAFVNIINDDLYGRLIQTKDISSKIYNEKPNITLIIKKYLVEENSVEATLAVTYNHSSIFKKSESDSINLVAIYSDSYYYNPSGIIFKSTFKDNVNKQDYGYMNSGFESNTFTIPVAPTINGFPFDDFQIRHNISLFINNKYSEFNLKVQKRIPGRLLTFEKGNKRNIILTRSTTEKATIVISSIIFLFLTSLLLYGFIKTPNGFNTVEELISIAGYLIAIAGFREIIGVSRINGTGTLEIIVILIPLILLFIGMIYSFNKGRKKDNYS
ncbi:hypothetical protein [Lacinutrix algicola]|uniref:hypothetical protein n=2 Tax=Lacinutrix algicola TaxID=342954 RepID=UPI0006E24BB6|nr:hypothetical protein [Lacinutrix algicola]